MLRILIIYSDYGRLGNRLHTHANALAWCFENNYNLINLSFSNYTELFKSSPKHNSGNLNQNENFIFKYLTGKFFRNFLKKLLLSDKWLERLTWIFNHIKPTNSVVLREADLSRQIHRKKINLIKHWDISCYHSVKIHQHKLRDYLRPKKKFVVTAEKIINGLRSKYDYIVGVHARRGDYASYLDGLHYHSWDSYLDWANRTKQILESSGKKNVGIVVCSDEIAPSSNSRNQDVYFSSSNEIMVDIHLLSLCDYNLGPPSSFGTWASWYGKVPRLVININTIIKQESEFKISKYI